jgi:hypothetical protein
VAYDTHRVSLDIDGLDILSGALPDRARRLTTEWARIHRTELRENWQRIRFGREPRQIEPLR